MPFDSWSFILVTLVEVIQSRIIVCNYFARAPSFNLILLRVSCEGNILGVIREQANWILIAFDGAGSS